MLIKEASNQNSGCNAVVLKCEHNEYLGLLKPNQGPKHFPRLYQQVVSLSEVYLWD